MVAIIRELIGPEWSRFRQLNVRFHGRSLEEAAGVEGGDAADGAGHDKRTPHGFLSACQGVLVRGSLAQIESYPADLLRTMRFHFRKTTWMKFPSCPGPFFLNPYSFRPFGYSTAPQ